VPEGLKNRETRGTRQRTESAQELGWAQPRGHLSGLPQDLCRTEDQRRGVRLRTERSVSTAWKRCLGIRSVTGSVWSSRRST